MSTKVYVSINYQMLCLSLTDINYSLNNKDAYLSLAYAEKRKTDIFTLGTFTILTVDKNAFLCYNSILSVSNFLIYVNKVLL